jgi:hypothetical protein
MLNINDKIETQSKNPCLKLTRFLYPKDEAELSFMMSLLKRKPCETCLFWACEIIYSGFDISQLLWSIYYDFYAQLNPSLFNKIGAALEKLNKHGVIEPILNVIKTMRVRQATDNVFSLRISQTPTRFTIYRGRVPSWLAGFEPEKRPLLRAICNYDWNQIMYYINQRASEPKELVKNILKVMTEKKIIGVRDGFESCDVDALWNNHGYQDEFHIILSLIVSLITPDTQIDFGSRIIKLNENERTYLSQLNSSEYMTNYTANILVWKRMCPVDEDVNVFDIVSTSISNDSFGLIKEIAYNWAYHCSQTPFWVRIFESEMFDAYLKKELDKNGIEYYELGFRNDDDYVKQETFEKTFGFFYDLDEPYMMEMWKTTVCLQHTKQSKDVVDLMEEIFGEDEKQVRIEFENITLSNNSVAYTGINNHAKKDTFDFTILNKLLDSI